VGEKKQLHQTAIDMYHFCGEQFRRRYIEGEKIPPAVAMIVGTGTDESVNQNMRHKMENGKLMELAQVKAVARDALGNAWSKGVWLSDDEAKIGPSKVKGQAIDKTVRLATVHATQKAEKINPTHVQRKWTVELKGYPVDLAGTIDVQEGGKWVRDTKTSGKTPNQNMADKSMQLTTYAMAVKVLDGKEPEGVALDYLIDTKEPKVVTLESKRNNDDFRILLRRIEGMIQAIDKGVFLPASPRDPMCSEKYCGFHSSCSYVKNK